MIQSALLDHAFVFSLQALQGRIRSFDNQILSNAFGATAVGYVLGVKRGESALGRRLSSSRLCWLIELLIRYSLKKQPARMSSITACRLARRRFARYFPPTAPLAVLGYLLRAAANRSFANRPQRHIAARASATRFPPTRVLAWTLP
jgi:hypothetical protein